MTEHTDWPTSEEQRDNLAAFADLADEHAEDARTFEVPVIVCVTVDVRPDGTTTVTGAGLDNEAAPWPFSADPCAWEPEGDGGDGCWHEGIAYDDNENPAVVAYQAAYGELQVSAPSLDPGATNEPPDPEADADRLTLDAIADLLADARADNGRHATPAQTFAAQVAELVDGRRPRFSLTLTGAELVAEHTGREL